MNGAIELPGEANPLNVQTLLNALNSASSSDSYQIQTGAKQLQKWETEQDYYVLLQDAFLQTALPFELRMLAIIQLKNGVEKYWRKSATNAIRSEERMKIRSRLLEASINEQNRALVSMSALVTAKVSRYEPDLIKEINDMLRTVIVDNESPKKLHHVLLILLYVIKELATIRIQRSRASLQKAAPGLLQSLHDIYLQKVKQWGPVLVNSPSSSNIQIEPIMMESLLTLKTIRHLILSGYDMPNKDTLVQTFWEVTKAHMNLCLNIYASGAITIAQLLALKHVIQFAKLHFEIAKMHPVSFAFLPGTIVLVREYWTNANILRSQLDAPQLMNDEINSALEKFVLIALQIMRACFKLVFSPQTQSFKYRNSEDRDEPKKARDLFKEELLTESYVNEIMETLISKYFKFSPGDLEGWIEEPEEWEMKVEGEQDAFEMSVRPCAERLFLDIAVHFKQVVVPPLLALFANLASAQYDDIFVKDAIYTAIGLAASSIHENVDFDTFLTTTVITELQIQQPHSNVMRRRIAILLAQWISVKISKANRPLVYQIYQHLLDKADRTNDQVVRLTAAKRFKDIAGEWEFEAEQFEPFAALILGSLMDLIKEVDMTETKLALLNTVSTLVERMEDRIELFVGQVVELLPVLWTESGDQHLMKQAILVTFDRLIRSTKSKSPQLQVMVLPIIQGALAPGSEMQSYLLEDALELWVAVLHQSDEPASTTLLEMIPLLLPVFDLGSENLLKALEIAKSYLLLAPKRVIDDEIKVRFLSIFTRLVDILKPQTIHLLTDLVGLLIRSAERNGGSQAAKMVVEGLFDAGFLPKIITSLHGNQKASKTTGPNRKDPVIESTTETKYFTIIARIVLCEDGLNLLSQILSIYGDDNGESEEQSMKWLLAEWFDHMDYVSVSTESKLLCLAITKLMESGRPYIMERLQDLMTLWTSIVSELRNGEDDDTKGSDSLVFKNPNEMRALNSHVLEEQRELEMTIADPVHSVNIVAYIHYQLTNAIQASGGEELFREQWLINVDQDVIKAFGGLEIM